MRTRESILKDHYLALIRRVANWVGIFAVIAYLFVPFVTVRAVGEMEPRKAALSTSAPSATGVTLTFSFTPPTNATIKAVGIQLCGSPIDGAACSQVASSDLSSATFSTAGQSIPFNASWAQGTGSDCGARTTTYICAFFTTGSNLSTGCPTSNQCVLIINNVKNPTTANTEFYARITTYNNYAAGTPSGETDYGAEALSTGTSLNVTALVQESLVFSVGQTGSCGSLSGTSVFIGGASLNTAILSQSAANKGTSVLCINTNASNGYQLSYVSSAGTGGGSCTTAHFTNCTGSTAHDFHDTTAANTFSSQVSGTQDFFGINIRNNVGANGDVASGADPTSGSGIVAPTYDTGYGTQDQFAFQAGPTVTPLAHETTGPTATIQYTTSYEAQAAPNTPFGQYEVNMDYICTSSY